MREVEFAQEFLKLTPRLERFFRSGMNKSMKQGDKALLAEDLVQLTAMEALENSRNPKYQDYEIRTLIILKARNVLADFLNPPKKKFATEKIAVLAEEMTGGSDQFDRLIMADAMESIRAICDDETWAILNRRITGYSYEEIAGEFHLTREALRQRIHRFREKIRQKWKDHGLY